jgi:hypothetical protein
LLDNVTPVESVTLSAYENEENKIWRDALGNSPHGHKWSTSFHSSSFPGNDTSVCGRAQVYKLLDPAPDSPLEPKVRALFDSGTVIEHMFIKRWSNYGVLLSADVTGKDDYQTNFEDSDCWLTGSPDAILLPPFWTKGFVVDVKTTSHSKVEAMRNDPNDTIYSHKKYVRQVQAYIYEANKKFSPTVVVCEKSGVLIKNGNDRCAVNHKGDCIPKILKVEPPDEGALFYSSREEPLFTASYYIVNDPDIVVKGKERVKSWKESFEQGLLPEHVREGESSKWSVGECKYCDMKAAYCKQDYKDKVKHLKDSNLISASKKVRPYYDYNRARSEIFKRWGMKDSLEKEPVCQS